MIPYKKIFRVIGYILFVAIPAIVGVLSYLKIDMDTIGTIQLGFDLQPILILVVIITTTSGILYFYLKTKSRSEKLESRCKNLERVLMCAHLIDRARFEVLMKGDSLKDYMYSYHEKSDVRQFLTTDPDTEMLSKEEREAIIETFYNTYTKKFQ